MKAVKVLRALEWSVTYTGAQPARYEPVYFSGCPSCGGIQPAKGARGYADPIEHFPPERVGHREGCMLRMALDDLEKQS